MTSAHRTILISVLVVAVSIPLAVVLTDLGDGPPVTEVPVVDDATPGGVALTDAVAELPPVDLEVFGGEGTVPISDYLGGVPLVINFWATWCGPCVAEMPDFQAIHERGQDDFTLLGINTQDSAVNAEPFVEELGITYDLAVDRLGEYFTETGSFGMPTTLFVEPDGTVAYRQTGPLSLEQMAALLDEHLDVQVPVTEG